MTPVDMREATRGSHHLSVGTLQADYSVVRSELTGNWIAIGTVRCTQPLPTPPASLLIGIGMTPIEAINDLRREMQARAPGLCPPDATP